jgi:hypothetical protein
MSPDWSTNDPTLYLPPATSRNPNYIATMFLSALLGHGSYASHPELLTTSASRSAWGDFAEARSFMASIPQPGVSTGVTHPQGASDIAYVALVGHAGEGHVFPAGTTIPDADVVTLVWTDDIASWRVHSIGPEVPPAHIPSRSIGLSPEES